MIPIALYRSGEAPVCSDLVETAQKNFIEELSSDITKFQKQFHFGNSGIALLLFGAQVAYA